MSSSLVTRTLAGLLGVLCLPVALVSATAAAPPAPPHLRVMPLGDSITAGVGSSTGAGYRLPLWQLVEHQDRYTAEFVGSQRGGGFAQPRHEGHSGWMIADLRAHVDGWLASGAPDVVLLHIGINDLDRGTDKAHAVDRLADLLDRIYTDRPATTVVLLGLLPTTRGLQDRVAAFNRGAQQLEARERALHRSLRWVAPPALTPAEFADTLHPNDRGYQRIARSFFDGMAAGIDLHRSGSGTP
ncbi:SGNH/GDSL hydrolase family protein [Kitasatospora sp. NPDC058965]|uniref:SGNH/GDSL hydrolase family protein n=1 Tax=Kitasatospora sp. NPDC058965 TaxID=3346682 RepID=UPI0036753B1C